MRDAYYFPHDSNAQHDEKILQLRAKYKWHGYGVYWAIIERLRESKEYKFSLTAISGLAISLSLAQAELEALLEECYSIGLLTKNKTYFCSESLSRRMAEIDHRRELLREAGRRGGIKSSQAQARLKHPSSSKGKESKGKEIDISLHKKFLDFVLLTEEQYSSLVAQLGENTTKQYIERLNNYIGAKGVVYKSHYHAIKTWHNKDCAISKKQEYQTP